MVMLYHSEGLVCRIGVYIKYGGVTYEEYHTGKCIGYIVTGAYRYFIQKADRVIIFHVIWNSSGAGCSRDIYCELFGWITGTYIPLNPATIGTVTVLGLPGVGLLLGLKISLFGVVDWQDIYMVHYISLLCLLG